MTLTAAALAAALAFGPALGAQGDGRSFQLVTVRPGDTLWAIANTYLKDPTRWDELLKYNKLPTSDPTVALPGLTLRVPVVLIKESMLAAALIVVIKDVSYRRRETADWLTAKIDMQLFRDDGLRTLAASRARVKFVGGDLLSLDENSMAILKPRDKKSDIELLRGEVHAGRSRVVTASARITPKTRDTRFSAKVREDLSTVVQVYAGLAAVEGHGRTRDVRAGYATEVAMNAAPAEPTRAPDTPEFRARLAGRDVFALRTAPKTRTPASAAGAGGPASPGGVSDINKAPSEFGMLEVGVPIAAYHFQISRARDFGKIALDEYFDPGQQVDLASRVGSGTFWIRVATVDLLGAEGRFSAPRRYSASGGLEAGPAAEHETLEVIRPPAGGERVRLPKYRLSGRADPGLAVSIDGRGVGLDEGGRFSREVLLKEGKNSFRFKAADSAGHEYDEAREVLYEP